MIITNEITYRFERVEIFEYLGVIFAAEPNNKEEISNIIMRGNR